MLHVFFMKAQSAGSFVLQYTSVRVKDVERLPVSALMFGGLITAALCRAPGLQWSIAGLFVETEIKHTDHGSRDFQHSLQARQELFNGLVSAYLTENF